MSAHDLPPVPIGHIQARWNEFSADFVNDAADPQRVAALRSAFYAGAVAAIAPVVKAEAPKLAAREVLVELRELFGGETH